MFIIVYAKITDAKKKGISLQGPFLGSECQTMEAAHAEAKSIVSSNKDMILIRIYPISEYSYDEAKVVAMSCFNTTYENMVAAASIIEKPSFKSSKKHRKITVLNWDEPEAEVAAVEVAVEAAIEAAEEAL